MPLIHIEDSTKSITVDSNLTDAYHASIVELWAACVALHAVVPLSSITFVIRPENPDKDAYDYAITTQDAREWLQRVWASTNEEDPFMTFDVTNQWRLSEFATQRRLRDALVVLVKDYRALSVIVTWM